MKNVFIWRDSKIASIEKRKLEPIIEEIKKLRLLIYYTSFGELHATLTNISIQTLLSKGNYKGDILVFGDDYFINNNQFSVNVVKVKKELYHPCLLKVFYADQIKAESYDQIMFIDSDIEVTNDIYSLFQAKDKLLYCEEPYGIRRTFPKNYATANYGFTEEEFWKYGDKRVVNSGCFCIDAKLFRRFIEEWRNIMLEHSLQWGSDQSGLNLLICRELIPSEPFKMFLIQLLHFFIEKKSAIMIHYVCETKNILLEKYGKELRIENNFQNYSKIQG